jgi:hypothetical protein
MNNMQMIKSGFFGAIGGAAFYLVIAGALLLFAPQPKIKIAATSSAGCGCGCGGK